MLKNYLRVAFRNLRRHKGYSFINVAGLTIGLACCLVIFHYVAFEQGFDTFNRNADRLHRVLLTFVQNGNADDSQSGSWYALGPALEQEVPEVARTARVHPDNPGTLVSNPEVPGRAFKEDRINFADPAFLRMFSYPLAVGDTARALAEQGTVLLSESAAQKYFGDEDPLGQVLDVSGRVQGSFRVTGIFRDVPANSHLQFDILLPMRDLLTIEQYTSENGWGWTNFFTYVELHEGADPAEVEQKVKNVILRFKGEGRPEGHDINVALQPVLNIHLDGPIDGPPSVVVVSSDRTVYFFTIVGIVTLLIALVNYVNLATARALKRAKEVGVRKVMGADRRQLIAQFLMESALTTAAALVFAVVLAAGILPLLNRLVGTELSTSLWASGAVWAAFLATFAACTVLAGLYPAFVLSSFRPVSVLSGKAGSSSFGLLVRQGLVVFQFAASIFLIGGTTIVYTQLGHMRNKDLGIDLDQVLVLESPRAVPNAEAAAAFQTFRQELLQLPAVRQIATSHRVPGKGFNYGQSVFRQEMDPSTSIDGNFVRVDSAFASLYGLQLIAGHEFDQDPDRLNATMINETAMRALGFANPEEALGQVLEAGGLQPRIIGVYRDFDWSSAHAPREPIFFLYEYREWAGMISVKVGRENLPQTISAIEETYEEMYPDNPFSYAFLDATFAEQYRNDERFALLFSIFAGLAIFIACLGLFGLAAFTAARRTKEIGVRKVLGATAPSIVGLLSKDFLMLVGIAFVVVAPLVYFAMQRWLEGFAYHIEIGPGIFLLTGTLVLLIALLTVSYQSIRAALADPVKSLRYE